MVGVGGKQRTDISAARAAWLLGLCRPLAGLDKSVIFFNVHIFKSTYSNLQTNLDTETQIHR